MAEDHNFAKANFGLRWSTFNFILLNMATLGLITYIWIWQLANMVGSEKEKEGNRVLAILILSFSSWWFILSYSDDPFWELISFGLYVAFFVLLEVLSFKTRAPLENMLAAGGYPIRLKGVWCFLLAFWYQYYIIYNAENIWSAEQGHEPRPIAPSSDKGASQPKPR